MVCVPTWTSIMTSYGNIINSGIISGSNTFINGHFDLSSGVNFNSGDFDLGSGTASVVAIQQWLFEIISLDSIKCGGDVVIDRYLWQQSGIENCHKKVSWKSNVTTFQDFSTLTPTHNMLWHVKFLATLANLPFVMNDRKFTLYK